MNTYFVVSLFWDNVQKLPQNLATGFNFSVKSLMYTYATQCENPIFVELLGCAAHLHSSVTLMLH